MSQVFDSETLSALAILKVNWDRFNQDYIENFVPFVAEVLRQSKDEVVSLQDLQEGVRNHFGLDLPLNPLKQILQRVAKHGYVRKDSGVFYRNQDRLKELNFSEVRGNVMSIHDRLLPRLRDFTLTEHGIKWSENDAAAAIHSFLINYSLDILFAKSERTKIEVKGGPQKAAYIIASFLTYYQEKEPQIFEDFTTLVKGHLLANAIYLPNPGSVAQRFQKTKIYLDTTVIIYAAGYAGPERQAPCEELLRLLYDYGADLRCLQFTTDEIRGVLDACAVQLHAGQLKDAYGPTIEWFIKSGKSASDLELMIARFPVKLRSLNIIVENRPDRLKEFQIDEKGFEKALEKAIHYRRPRARIHDVDCISAVAQLRRGVNTYQLEFCGALFVTTNTEIARITRHFFQAEAPEGTVSLCITDYALGNLLWLKNPTRAPELPHKFLIADAFAAMQPPDDLWATYLAEIANLQQAGQINADEYFAMRYSITARRALMDLTNGEVSAFTEGTVKEVLKVATENIRADLKSQLEQAQSTINQLEQHETVRQQKFEVMAKNVAKRTSRIAFYLIFAILAIGALLTFPWSLPQITQAWLQYCVTAILLALFFLYTIVSIGWGTSVKSIAEKFEHWLSKHLHYWLLRTFE